MSCNEVNCINLSCALCYHCQQSLCLHHIIIHHDILIERHLSVYESLQQLYEKLHTMSIERCYHQVIEQLSSNENYSSNSICHLRAIREELIERLNRFKQKQLYQLQRISFRLYDRKQMITDDEMNDILIKLEQIQTSINSLVYGIHLDISKTSKTIQYWKIFHDKTSSSPDVRTDLPLRKSSSWTNGLTENYWTKKSDVEDRLSLF